MIDAETMTKLQVLQRLSPPLKTNSPDVLLGYLHGIKDALEGFRAVAAVAYANNDEVVSKETGQMTFALGALGGTLQRLSDEVAAAYEATRARHEVDT